MATKKTKFEIRYEKLKAVKRTTIYAYGYKRLLNFNKKYKLRIDFSCFDLPKEINKLRRAIWEAVKDERDYNSPDQRKERMASERKRKSRASMVMNTAYMSELRAKVVKVFSGLRKKGYLARANFLCCQGCAGYAMAEKAEDLLKSKKKKRDQIRGSVFWHKQDEGTYWERGTLFLAYGDLEINGYRKPVGIPTVDVGHEVCKALSDAGIPYDWNGDSNTRIEIIALLTEAQENEWQANNNS